MLAAVLAAWWIAGWGLLAEAAWVWLGVALLGTWRFGGVGARVRADGTLVVRGAWRTYRWAPGGWEVSDGDGWPLWEFVYGLIPPWEGAPVSCLVVEGPAGHVKRFSSFATRSDDTIVVWVARLEKARRTTAVGHGAEWAKPVDAGTSMGVVVRPWGSIGLNSVAWWMASLIPCILLWLLTDHRFVAGLVWVFAGLVATIRFLAVVARVDAVGSLMIRDGWRVRRWQAGTWEAAIGEGGPLWSWVYPINPSFTDDPPCLAVVSRGEDGEVRRVTLRNFAGRLPETVDGFADTLNSARQ